MIRGVTGVLPRTPRLEDESYLDLMQSVRNFAIRELFPVVAAQAETALGSGASTMPLDEFVTRADRLPAVGAWKRLMRSQQQRTWSKIRDSLHLEAEQHLAELERAEREWPGRLHRRAGFEVPKYASLDIHLQPGGYVGDPLAGYVFHHGTKVFYQGDNDQDELHRQVVGDVRLPLDGVVRRVLDLGCSIGQCTTALKERFAAAEVTGLDVGLPLLRYAHKRASELGVDVQFVHGLAEDTQLDSGTCDVVLCYILFHEVPSRLFLPILREARRLLRPGGALTIVDAPNAQTFPAGNRLWLEFDAHHNCEPYSPAFVAADLPALLAEAGFESIESGPTPTFLTRTTAIKPPAARD
jgi:ubiquinone/menaquinone biosynthesis C-methylase UbiE